MAKMKGQSLLATVMITGVVLFVLGSISVLMGVTSSHLFQLGSLGGAAAYAGESGIREALQVMMEGYYGELPASSPYYSMNNNTQQLLASYFPQWNGKTFPSNGTYVPLPNDPHTGYRVTIAAVANKPGPQNLQGVLVTFSGIGQSYSQSATVTDSIWIYAYPSNLYNYAFLSTNKLSSCSMCHTVVNGGVGQVSTQTFQMWSSYDRQDIPGPNSNVSGTFILHGNYDLSSYSADGTNWQQQQYLLSNPNLLYPNVPYSDNSLPTTVPYIHQNLQYFVNQGQTTNGVISCPPMTQCIQQWVGGVGITPKKQQLLSGTLSGGTPSYDHNYTLDGTGATPLTIDGTVFIDGDILIKGLIQGQGKIVTSRNIYIVGDITYSPNPTDQLALMAGGSVLIGDPFAQWSNSSDTGWFQFIYPQLVDKSGTSIAGDPDQFLGENYAWDSLNQGGAGRSAGTPPTAQIPGTGGSYYTVTSCTPGTSPGCFYLWHPASTVSQTQPPTSPGLLPVIDQTTGQPWISVSQYNAFQGQANFACGPTSCTSCSQQPCYYYCAAATSNCKTANWSTLPPGSYQNVVTHVDGAIYADYAVGAINEASPAYPAGPPNIAFNGLVVGQDIALLGAAWNPNQSPTQQPEIQFNYDNRFANNQSFMSFGNLVKVLLMDHTVSVGTRTTLF